MIFQPAVQVRELQMHLSGMVEIGMVSREIYPEEIKKGAFPIAVTKDAVVAVVSEQNPILNDYTCQRFEKRCRE